MKAKKILSMFMVINVILAVISTGSISVEANEIGSVMSDITSCNDYIKLLVNPTGRFTLGTTGGDPALSSDDNKALLYGFNYDGPTSMATMLVDGDDRVYGSDIAVSPYYNEDGTVNTSISVFNNIEVKQILSFVKNPATNREDIIQIKYEAVNTDTVSHSVGLRILLDTMLGENDHSKIRAAGVGELTYEAEFVGDEIPEYWMSFDNIISPEIISFCTLTKNIENKPDRVQFADWRYVDSYDPEYKVRTDAMIEDSSVAIIWDEKDLPAGDSVSFVTYYGLGEMVNDVNPPLAVSMYCDAFVYQKGIIYETNEFEYDSINVTAYVENLEDCLVENVFIRIDYPSNFSLSPGCDSIYRFDSLSKGEIKEITWDFEVNGDTEIGTYPIIVICGSDTTEEKKLEKYINIIGGYIDNRIQWEGNKDVFSFTNSSEYFCYYDQEWIDFFGWNKKKVEDYYHISNGYMNFLIRNMNDKVKKTIKKEKTKNWIGSCYGMSAVLSLVKAGYITPNKWQYGADNICDLDNPNDNNNIADLINFYHLSQLLPDIMDLKCTYESMSIDTDEQLYQLVKQAKKVRNGGMPVLLCYQWLWCYTSWMKHAVIAYDVESDGEYLVGAYDKKPYKYKVYIYDPNYSYETHLYVTEKYDNWYYDGMIDTIDYKDYISFDEGNEIKDIIMVLYDIGSIDIRNPETMEDRTILHDYTKLYYDNYDAEGDIDIVSASNEIIDYKPTSAFMTSDKPLNGGIGDISVLPDDQELFTVVPKNGKTSIDMSMIFENYFLCATSKNVESAVYEKKGKITVNKVPEEYTINLLFDYDKEELPWEDVYASGKNAGFASLEAADQGVIFTSDNMNDIKISAGYVESDDYYDVYFSTNYVSVDIRAVDNETLGVYIDRDNDGEYETLIADSNGTDYGTYEKPDGESTTESETESREPTSSTSSDSSMTETEISAESTNESTNESTSETTNETANESSEEVSDSSNNGTSVETITINSDTNSGSNNKNDSTSKASDTRSNSTSVDNKSGTAPAQTAESKDNSTNISTTSEDSTTQLTGENGKLLVILVSVCLTAVIAFSVVFIAGKKRKSEW